MKKLITALAVSLIATAASASSQLPKVSQVIEVVPGFTVTLKEDPTSPCVNILNPFSGKYLRQAEIDTGRMMNYFTEAGFKKITLRRGPCITSFNAQSERGEVEFEFSTVTGELVGIISFIADDTLKHPDLEALRA
jgi:hypothetical protein